MKIRMFGVVCLSILVIVLTSLLIVNANLSDETKGLVEDLRIKHYGHGTLYCSDAMVVDMSIYDKWISLWFEDGILYIETQDGKWFIEMDIY